MKYDPVIETENQKKDLALYYNKKGNVDQVAKWNNHIIDKTIKEYEAKRKLQGKLYTEKLKERIDAAMDFVFWREQGGNEGKSLESYFSKRKIAELQGRHTLDEIKARLKNIALQNGVRISQQHEDIY